MSELPPEPTPSPVPVSPAPMDIAYETPPPGGNAPTLIRLAGIFGMVSCGIDLLYALGMGGLSVGMHYLYSTVIPAAAAAAPPAPGAAPPPAMPPGTVWLMVATYGIPALLSLLVLTPKLIGASKLLRQGRSAWGWGLAMGIICCSQLWMFQPCCVPYLLPLATGIYTIIILSLPHVRTYLVAKNGPGASDT
jgi:hypothetical protein